MQISLIVPVLNDAAALASLLASQQASLPKHADSGNIEVIVSDGGSSDGSAEAVKEFPGARLVQGPRGRAAQMNRGASLARGDVLWFLHADSQLPAAAAELILESLSDPEVVAGAFRFAVDGKGVFFRLLEYGVRFRSERLGLPYGDQGFFVRREVFERLGGYPELPILEDVCFWKLLRRAGKTRIVPAALVTSSRRWEKRGMLLTSFTNLKILALHLCGVSPERLAQYRR